MNILTKLVQYIKPCSLTALLHHYEKQMITNQQPINLSVYLKLKLIWITLFFDSQLFLYLFDMYQNMLSLPILTDFVPNLTYVYIDPAKMIAPMMIGIDHNYNPFLCFLQTDEYHHTWVDIVGLCIYCPYNNHWNKYYHYYGKERNFITFIFQSTIVDNIKQQIDAYMMGQKIEN